MAKLLTIEESIEKYGRKETARRMGEASGQPNTIVNEMIMLLLGEDYSDVIEVDAEEESP